MSSTAAPCYDLEAARTYQERPVMAEQLAEQLRPMLSGGDVFLRRPSPPESGDGEGDKTDPFEESTRLFNSAAPLGAWIVVRPKNTADVVATINFCRTHGISPSVRSGGFSTAGWSIQGDLVLDMQLMDSIQMIAPGRCGAAEETSPAVGVKMSTSLDAPASRPGEPLQGSALPQKDHREADARIRAFNVSVVENGTIKVETNSAGVIDREAHGPEYNIGARSTARGLAMDGSNRRRKAGEAFQTSPRMGQEEASGSRRKVLEQDLDAFPRTKSGDSGAEADAESSSGSKSSGKDNAEGGTPSFSDGGERTGSGESRSGGSRSPERTSTPWVDRFLDSVPDGSNSSSGNSRSESNTGVASIDADSEDPPRRPEVMPSSPEEANLHRPDGMQLFEHERWQRHHQPPGSIPSGSQTVLPERGGFIWTAGDNNGAPATTRSLGDDPVYMGGSTFGDLQAQQHEYQQNRTGVSPFLSHASLYDAPAISSSASVPSAPTKSSLPPGIHKDRYMLCSFGPGVGCRGIDSFTDKAGRLSGMDARGTARGKGKEKDLRVNSNGIDIVAHGVPYHVPLSAYPVGSTVMTTGGFGYLVRAYGLSLDNVVEIELVLADGRVMTLNESSKTRTKEEADLWWAVRGAAPCFGVVTRIVAKAYPVPSVYAGNLIYPMNPITAPSLIRHWRDCLKGSGDSVPRELYSNLILTAGPDQSSDVIVIQVSYLGDRADGEAFVHALSSWTGERVLLKDIEERSFLSQQDGVAQVLKNGQGRRWMVRGDLVSTLTDEVIADTVERFSGMGNLAVWLFELVGGAVEDVEEHETCVGPRQRAAKFTVGALHQWSGKEEDEQCANSVDGWVKDVLSKVSIGGPYACFLERKESRERVEGSFGKDNFERLLQLKRDVDPEGLFRHTFGAGLTNFV